MTRCDWEWDVIERVNLDECPTDDWEEAYHWLDDELSSEVVVDIDENLERIGYVVDVIEP